MLNYMFMPFRRYAEFNGRSRRMEFWAFGLFNAIVYLVIFGFLIGTYGTYRQTLMANSLDYSAALGFLTGGSGLLLLVYWLATIVPTIAVTVRRLHDRDMSGWWYLGFFVASMIPIVGLIAGIAFLVLTLLPGTPGANRFGPDPKDPANAQVFA